MYDSTHGHRLSANPIGLTTPVGNHVAINKAVRHVAPAVEGVFLYTARPFDGDSGLQNNLNRWYDPSVGRWISEDPIGFEGGDGNLYRYVGNSPLALVDAAGLNPTDEEPPGPGVIIIGKTLTVNKHYDATVSFLGTLVHVHTHIPSITTSVTIAPDAESGGIKWSAYIQGSVITTFAGAKKWQWQDSFGGDLYEFWAQVSLAGKAGGVFVGGASGIVCPPKVLPNWVAVSASAASSSTLTGSVGITLVKNVKFTGFVAGNLKSTVMVSANLNLETADVSGLSMSPPSLSGNAYAHAFLTVPTKKPGTTETYQIQHDLF